MGVVTRNSRSAAIKKSAARKPASKSGARSFMFEAAAETMPREELRKLQLRRLKASIKHAYDNVAIHRERMKALGAVTVADSPAEFAAFLKQDHERWARVIKAAHVTVE